MEQQATKTCYVCGTENELDYRFCKNCGAVLGAPASGEPKREEETHRTQFYPQPSGNVTFTGGTSAGEDRFFDGVSVDQMRIYVGKNSEKFLGVFTRFQMFGKRTGWCWPVFVLGYFFGLIGQSFWFFYRKMYKTGALLAAAGVLLLGIQAAVSYEPLTNLYATALSSFQDTGDDSLPADDPFSSEYNETFDSIWEVQEAINDNPLVVLCRIINLIAVIVNSIFAFSMYYNYAKVKIKRYTAYNMDNSLYNYQLAALGGTSGGALALSIIFYLLLNATLTLAPLFTAMSILH